MTVYLECDLVGLQVPQLLLLARHVVLPALQLRLLVLELVAPLVELVLLAHGLFFPLDPLLLLLGHLALDVRLQNLTTQTNGIQQQMSLDQASEQAKLKAGSD